MKNVAMTPEIDGILKFLNLNAASECRIHTSEK